MRPVPVQYMGDGVSQGGAMVLEEPPEEKPDYVTRLAPLWVYDCLAQKKDGRIPIKEGKAAAYLCLCAEEGTSPGIHRLVLGVKTENGSWECEILVRVYAVRIPSDAFPVTNWFSLESDQPFSSSANGDAGIF